VNTYDFFNRNLGTHLVSQEGTPWEATQRALSANHRLKKGSMSRLGSGWAVVREGRATVQLALDAAGIEFDTRTRYEAFLEVLENWSDEPVLLMTFDKKPLSISQLFITADIRAVRICTPKGVQSFDWTREPSAEACEYHRILWKQRAKKDLPRNA
jgi:hypothetical protein